MRYKILNSIIKGVGSLPFGILYALAAFLYFLVYYVVRYRRKIVRKNLTECFPEKSDKEIKQIEKKFYHFFADNMVETIKMAAISHHEMRKRMKFTNIDEINRLLDSGKSVALFLGHYGNWEWISSMPLHLPHHVTAAQIYHKLADADFDRIMLQNRARMGATNVEMRKTARFITSQIAEGKLSIVGFIADQAPKERDIHYFLPFLNHSTPVLTGVEKIVKHYGFEAWFVDVKRVGRGRYEATYVKMHSDPASLPDFELTDIYYRMLEDMIRRDPTLYLWTHKRFRNAKKL